MSYPKDNGAKADSGGDASRVVALSNCEPDRGESTKGIFFGSARCLVSIWALEKRVPLINPDITRGLDKPKKMRGGGVALVRPREGESNVSRFLWYRALSSFSSSDHKRVLGLVSQYEFCEA